MKAETRRWLRLCRFSEVAPGEWLCVARGVVVTVKTAPGGRWVAYRRADGLSGSGRSPRAALLRLAVAVQDAPVTITSSGHPVFRPPDRSLATDIDRHIHDMERGTP